MVVKVRLMQCIECSSPWCCLCIMAEPCQAEQFHCDNGQCVDQRLVCDEYRQHDCRDGSDEKHCDRLTYYTGQGEKPIGMNVLYHCLHTG